MKLTILTSKNIPYQRIGFDHLVQITYDGGWHETRHETSLWLQQNFDNRWCYIPGTDGSVIAFMNEFERNWFILRWS